MTRSCLVPSRLGAALLLILSASSPLLAQRSDRGIIGGVVADPQGASFCLWQAKKHIGATIRSESNTLCWNELMTPDSAASATFYKSLFGWNLKPSPEYTEISVGSVPIGGMLQITKDMQGTPPNWAPYFAVDDCDAMVAKAKSLGAQVYVPPTEIPKVGRFSALADPQGATFEVIQLAPGSM